MESPSNRFNLNLCGDDEDKRDSQSVHDSPDIEQFLRHQGISQTAAETEPMSKPRLGQLQSADLPYSNPQIEAPADRQARRRAMDKRYRDRQKEKQEQMKHELETLRFEWQQLKKENESLKGENESLKRENDWVNQKFETLLQQLKELCECERQLKSNLTVLKDENEFLKKDNVLLREELDKLKKNEKMRAGHPSNENSKPMTTFSGSSEDVGSKNSVGGSSASIARHLQNQDLSIGAQNLSKINQIATETEPMRQQQSGQCQPAELSANSQSSRDIAEITAAKQLSRKRAKDRAYTERVKAIKRQLESDINILAAKREGLKIEIGLPSDDFKTKLEILDTSKMCWKQYEQQMKSNPETLRSKNECLKQGNDFLNMFETKSVELGILKNMYEKMRTTDNLSMEDSKPITACKAENQLLRSEKEFLEYETKFLKEEIVSLNQKVEIQLKELDELRKNFDELKKKYEEQHERIRQLEHDIRTRDAKIEDLNGRYIAVLENFRYATENTRSEIPLDKSAQQPVPRTNSPGNSDCGSGTGA